MKSNTWKLVSVGLLVPVTGLAFYMMLQLNAAVNEVPDRLVPEVHKGSHAVGHGEAKTDAHGAPAGGHGEAKTDAHGAPAGGHGEAKADAHGAPAGGHGEAKADAHGAPAGGHGAPATAGERSPASVGLVSVDEVYVNVGTGQNIKSLGLKIELEIFEEDTRSLFEQNVTGIRHTVIEASRDQDSDRLHTVSGKLYFKENLVTRLNAFFKRAVVREVHFSSFYLQ